MNTGFRYGRADRKRPDANQEKLLETEGPLVLGRESQYQAHTLHQESSMTLRYSECQHTSLPDSDPDGSAAADFERIARTYGDLLLHTAQILVEDAATAEDVVQTSLELAWRHLPALRERAALKAWLIKIVMNQAMSVRRHEVRSQSYLRNAIRVWTSEIAAAAAADANATLEQVWDLRAAICRLPSEQRAMIVLHYYLDMSVPEMTAMLSISPNTIKKRLRTALRRLRQAIGAPPAQQLVKRQ